MASAGGVLVQSSTGRQARSPGSATCPSGHSAGRIARQPPSPSGSNPSSHASTPTGTQVPEVVGSSVGPQVATFGTQRSPTKTSGAGQVSFAGSSRFSEAQAESTI